MRDRRAYLRLLARSLRAARHDLPRLVPDGQSCPPHSRARRAQDGLRAPLASAHTAYSQRDQPPRTASSGHLFQGRFASYPMDDAHLMVAARYVENNPVAAGLVGAGRRLAAGRAPAPMSTGCADGLTDIAALVRTCRQLAGDAGPRARGRPTSAERVAAALRSTGRPLGAVALAPRRRASASDRRPSPRPVAAARGAKNRDCPLFCPAAIPSAPKIGTVPI